MTIQKIGNTWHIIDKANDTKSTATSLNRALNNALWKNLVYKGTKNPIHEYDALIEEEVKKEENARITRDIQNRKRALLGARLAHIY